MTSLIGRNHLREVVMQWLRDRLKYKPGIYQKFYDPFEAIFIHIPKNAGTSVTTALYGAAPWHWTATDLYHINCSKYQRYFKFALVRNPWDRLYSSYCYAPRDVQKFDGSPLKWMTRYPDFESFVMDGMSEEIAVRHYFIGLQLNYLTLPSGSVDPTIKIGRIEDLSNFLSEVSIKLPRLRSTGMENVSPHRQPLQQVYTKEMIERVRCLYLEDINEFSYKFPTSIS